MVKRRQSGGGKYSQQIGMRFTSKMLVAIEQARAQLALERPGQEIGVSDVIRALVAEGLANRQIALK